MRMQSNASSCGPAAVSNALRALGKDVSEQQVEEAVARTQRKGAPKEAEGTTENQIKRALDALKCTYNEFSLAHADAAVAVLRQSLADGHPVLLAVDGSEHWVVAVGTIGDRILICDAADSDLIMPTKKDSLLKRWGEVGDVILYYGIAILTCKRK